MTNENTYPLEGIGGWLALLAFVQAVGVARLLFGFFQQLQGYGPLASLSGGPLVVVLEVAMNLGLIALALATTYALFMKKRTFVRLFLWQWLAIPVVFVLDWVLVASALDVPLAALAGPEDTRAVSTFLATALWVWYTRKSKRVANTMVN